MRSLKLIVSEDWSNLDEKAWVKKYQVIPHSNFIWKSHWVGNSSYIMNCGDKA